jgi:hypothetical protein
MLSLRSSLTGPALVGALLVFAAACSDSPVETNSTNGPLSLNVVSGDAQSGLANTELPDPLVVQVLDTKGHRVRDQIVNFRVVAGGGSVFAGTSLTNSDGIAMEWWTLGASGAQRVEVRAVDPTTGEKQVFATFNATIAAPPPPAITPDAFEPNDAQQIARLIGNMNSGQSLSLSANFHILTDVDWFQYRTLESGGSCGFPGSTENFAFTVTLGNVPAGSTYSFSIFEGTILRGSRSVTGGGSPGTFAYNYTGVCGQNDDTTFDVKVERTSGDPSATLYSLGVTYTGD